MQAPTSQTTADQVFAIPGKIFWDCLLQGCGWTVLAEQGAQEYVHITHTHTQITPCDWLQMAQSYACSSNLQCMPQEPKKKNLNTRSRSAASAVCRPLPLPGHRKPLAHARSAMGLLELVSGYIREALLVLHVYILRASNFVLQVRATPRASPVRATLALLTAGSFALSLRSMSFTALPARTGPRLRSRAPSFSLETGWRKAWAMRWGRAGSRRASRGCFLRHAAAI